MKILRGNDVQIEWTIARYMDGSEVEEDFSRAELKVYLTNAYNKEPALFSVDRNVITISIPGNTQQSGWLSMEAVWSKNGRKNWSRAVENKVVFFTENQDVPGNQECKENPRIAVIPVRSQLAGGIGYDGITPHIGENGHWYIGETDTEVMADRGSRINVVSELPATGVPGEFYAVFE